MFTSKQISALRYMIFNAKNGTELSKRVLAFLIESSEELTKEVCLSLVADREGYTADEISAAGHGVGSMESCNGTTHLDQILHVMGSELSFSIHYGDFDPTRTDDPFNSDGMFGGWDRSQVTRPGLILEGMPLRYTFWLSKKNYSRQAALVVATREELEQIDLKKPGLYPSLEPA
ncbi:MAG: hypothetical protein AAB355_02525 [Patescibacteria group bacterium]